MPIKAEVEPLESSTRATKPTVHPTIKRGRHPKGCGADFLCPTGKHQSESASHLTLDASASKPESLAESNNPQAKDAVALADPSQKWAQLRLIGQTFHDVQKLRVAMNNRLNSASKDGVEVLSLTSSVNALSDMEKVLSKDMRKILREDFPKIWAWIQNSPGIGEHLTARLISVIGDPVIAHPYHWEGEGGDRKLVADAPFRRNIGKLWAYCGHGNPTLKRKKGMAVEEVFALGNPNAKMIVHLLAESCVKVGKGPYRNAYACARVKYASRTDWSLGHQHNAALRLVGKEILRDLWLAQANDGDGK